MNEATMDHEREAPLEELEARGYEAEDDDSRYPIGAVTPTLICAPGREVLLGD